MSSTDTLSVGDWFSVLPVTRAQVLAGFALFIAFVIESWEMMIIIFSSGAISSEFALDAQATGSLIGAMFLGMIPGALLWGQLTGRFGRKKTLLISLALYPLFPVLSALAPSFETLWAIRFAGGIVLAGPLVITFPYFVELVPVRHRGPATVCLSAGWPVGLLVAVGVTTLFADSGWRVTIGFSAVVGLWALVILKCVPESPYWLAERGELARAKQALQRLSAGQVNIGAIAAPTTSDETIAFSRIFTGSRLRLTIVQTVINFCFSWGYWGMASWMPALLAERGLSAPQGLGFIALSALFMFPGYLSASYLTAKLGRKGVMLTYVFCAAVAGFGFAYSGSLAEMYAWNFALSFFSLGAWGVWNTWLGEIYDTRARGAGTAWGVSAQRVANAIAPVAIGSMMATNDFFTTVAFISLFLAVTFVAATLLPETEGKALA
ncbi:MAG: MFS transporter [Pseudomonadota bacterium]